MIERNELQIVMSKIVTQTFSDHLFQKKCYDVARMCKMKEYVYLIKTG